MLKGNINKSADAGFIPEVIKEFYESFKRAKDDRLVLQEKYNTQFCLDKNYEIVDCIGQGAYGIVAAVRDRRTDEFFAVKKVANLTDGDTTVLKRTLREIRILRHLTHENV